MQHKDNPVDWYPWGDEALAKSRNEDKPIFLSIGYSSCHWCHVMEHESFENESIASFLNDHFVSIKVDREERPDLDQIYMNGVMALRNGQGGWPLSAFLTPDCQIFFGGTYWPATSSRGMPGFDQVLQSVLDAYQNRREQVDEQAEKMTEFLQQNATSDSDGEDADSSITENILIVAANALRRAVDARNGGFGGAPKFPHAMDLQLLMRLWYRWHDSASEKSGIADELLNVVKLSLDKMADGGIYDHLAGGFARYSVDEKWLVPHFEKMLYDNALLAETYVDAFLITRKDRYRQTAIETLDYVLNYMTDEKGGFYSAEDADSEGVEGKFYVWSMGEINSILGEDVGEKFCAVYDVSEIGNFEGANILNLSRSIKETAKLRGWDDAQLKKDVENARPKLLKIRDERVRPGRDDKVIVSWNGMMINAMVRAGRSFKESRFIEAAQKSGNFILENLVDQSGELLHTWRADKSKLKAYLDDYACLINALISLYETDFDAKWIDAAVSFAEIVLKKFSDTENGGFYFVPDDHERLIARNKDAHDSSVPSGNSMMATALIRLGRLCIRNDFLEVAERTISSNYDSMHRSPMAYGQLLIAVDAYLGKSKEVIFGCKTIESAQSIMGTLFERFRPHLTVAANFEGQRISDHLKPLMSDKTAKNDDVILFICENQTCQSPVNGTEAITTAIEQLT